MASSPNGKPGSWVDAQPTPSNNGEPKSVRDSWDAKLTKDGGRGK